MGTLIKLLGRLLARRIERGSTAGAIVGALLGILLGIVCARMLVNSGKIDADYAMASYLILSIPLALAGALAGAAFGPHGSPASARTGVRLTRYNRAAGSLMIAIILLVCVLALVVKPDPASRSEMLAIGIVIILLFLISALRAVREIWSITLGPTIFMRRLIGSRSYSRHDLTLWGFAVAPRKVIQTAFTGAAMCHFQFKDGSACKIEVRGADSQAVVDVLSMTEKA